MRWQYFLRAEDRRYVLCERGDYAGDFPNIHAMFAWLNREDPDARAILVPTGRVSVPSFPCKEERLPS